MGECDHWTTVDFGRGSVDIRCTQTGTHIQHRTEVFHRVQRAGDDQPEIDFGPVRRNIFENSED